MPTPTTVDHALDLEEEFYKLLTRNPLRRDEALAIAVLAIKRVRDLPAASITAKGARR